MSAQIINGKEIAQEIESEIIHDVEGLKSKGIQPGLAVILVGDDPASSTYVRMKGKACERLGFKSETITLPSEVTKDQLLKQIDEIKDAGWAHGLLVQLPLPVHIDEKEIIEAIPPEMDVDGFHPISRGKLSSGEDTFVPCTPAGIQELLLRSNNSPEGKHVVIVGRSKIVGLPLANLLIQKRAGANATVTICHSRTKSIEDHTKKADIIIAAIGKPNTITADMVNPHSTIIDVGVNRVDDAESKRGYRLVGDVDFERVVPIVKAITPVPGGVGPMTIAMLMKNTLVAAQKSIN